MFVSRSHAPYLRVSLPAQHRPEGFEAELLRVVTDAYSRLDYVMDAEFGDMECGGSTAVVALIIRDR